MADLNLELSNSDITDIAKNAKLVRDQLQHLFIELGMETADIRNAERSANTRDFQLESIAVLKSWRQANEGSASRRAIITALKECCYNQAKGILLIKWASYNQVATPGATGATNATPATASTTSGAPTTSISGDVYGGQINANTVVINQSQQQ